MAVSLVKGQKVDLTKGKVGLTSLRVGLGWDEAERSGGGGIFGALKKGSAPIDCDASVFMLDSNGRMTNSKDLIYFGRLKSSCGSVIHNGDNLTGEGEGDDEVINIELNKVPNHIDKLVFVVNIYDCAARKQHFGMIKNAFIRVLDDKTNVELIRYNLTDDYDNKTGLLVAEIYRHKGEWKFNALGEGTLDRNLTEMSNRFI